MMSKYRAAVVGLGRIGWKLEDDPKRPHPCTHAGAIAALDDLELVAGASRSATSAEEFQKRWHTAACYTDYREMVQTEEIEIASVATNPETHAQVVKDLSSLGVKGILCEKPIALSLRDADEMIDCCEKHGTALMIMHNRRWNSIYLATRELLKAGSIGNVNSVVGICQGCKPTKNWQSDFEGPLLHDATHLFDILRFFFGDVHWISSEVERAAKTDRVEDSAYSLIRFRNGVIATTLVNERTDYMRFEIEIQCSHGKVVLQTNEAALWKFEPSKYASGFRELVGADFPYPSTRNNVYLEAFRELVECVREKHPVRTSSGQDGRAALEIIMGIYESKRNGVGKVELPLKSGPSHLEAAVRELAF